MSTIVRRWQLADSGFNYDVKHAVTIYFSTLMSAYRNSLHSSVVRALVFKSQWGLHFWIYLKPAYFNLKLKYWFIMFATTNKWQIVIFSIGILRFVTHKYVIHITSPLILPIVNHFSTTFCMDFHFLLIYIRVNYRIKQNISNRELACLYCYWVKPMPHAYIDLS